MKIRSAVSACSGGKRRVKSLCRPLRISTPPRSKITVSIRRVVDSVTSRILPRVPSAHAGRPARTPAGRLDPRMGILDRILRAGEGKKLKALEGLVPDINAHEPPRSRRCPTTRCAAKTAEFRQRIERGEIARRPARRGVRRHSRGRRSRVIGQRHFDVQLMGGAALHFGWVAEMKTGEGKTLVCTLPAYLNGLGGKGVHLVTVNDYLARFHAEWMGRIHKWLGLDVGLVIPGFKERPAEKRAAYAADITYGTNNEFGFDYLRDNMAPTLDDKTQRGHNYAIVDEVDSILIDEARTPLIISGRLADAAKLYYRFASHRPLAQARRRLRGRRGQAHRRPARGRHRQGRAGARHRQPVRRGAAEPGAPAAGRAEGQGAVQARQGLHHPERRGEDRRRVHRPHPRRPALERGHPPGRRGQGGREDQGREPDARHDHPAELLPHVRQARRHDRHGRRPRPPS